MKALKNLAFCEVLGKLPDGREQKLAGTYAELAREVANHIPQGGLNVTEMRKRLRLVEAVEGVAVDATIQFEDEDAKTLQKCAAAMPWAVVAKPIVEFCDAVENMKAPEPTAADDAEGAEQS